MTNRHLLARIRVLEKKVQDRPPDPEVFLAAIERETLRVRELFVTGVEQPPLEHDTQIIEAYFRSTGLDGMHAGREKEKMLAFGRRGA